MVDNDVSNLKPLARSPYTMHGRTPITPAALRRAEGVLMTLRDRGVSIERYRLTSA